MTYPKRKVKLLKTFLDAFSNYEQVLLVEMMNIATEQIVKTRVALRKNGGLIVIGKNTLAKLAIKILSEDNDPNADYAELQK